MGYVSFGEHSVFPLFTGFCASSLVGFLNHQLHRNHMLVVREVKRISINTVEGSAYLGTRFSYISAHVQKYLCSTKLRSQTVFFKVNLQHFKKSQVLSAKKSQVFSLKEIVKHLTRDGSETAPGFGRVVVGRSTHTRGPDGTTGVAKPRLEFEKQQKDKMQTNFKLDRMLFWLR